MTAAASPDDTVGRRIFRRLARAGRIRQLLAAPAPVRPIVLFQSDDWGRAGAPSLDSLARLARLYPTIGRSPWDRYGLETEEDLLRLAETASELRDRDGQSVRFTANFVLANLDTRRMCAEGYRDLRLVSLADGFPAPWADRLLDVYRQLVRQGTFYPGMHGPTHFNPSALMRLVGADSDAGRRARDLLQQDIPYLASLTPEFNFALVERNGNETFVSEAEQARWLSEGVRLFRDVFGVTPRTACAPGYRANDVTFQLWRQLDIEATQITGSGALSYQGGLVVLERNVFFEPVLRSDAVEAALASAIAATMRGYPIIVCTHSINYISRFLGRAKESREALVRFCRLLIESVPDVRFSSEPEVVNAFRSDSPGWFRRANAREIAVRIGAAMTGRATVDA